MSENVIRFKFDQHGLGDVVHACLAVQLFKRRGYRVQVQVEENKRWLWQVADVEIVDGDLPNHGYPYLPSMDAFFNLSLPDSESCKVMGFFDQAFFPMLLEDSAEIWNELRGVRLNVAPHIPQEAHAEAEEFLANLPRPIIVLHSKGSNWQAEKSIPDDVAYQLIGELLATGGSVVVLDYDARVPTISGHSRVKNLKPEWGHIGIDRLCALLQRVDLMIGVDSGPFHVAGLTQTQCLGVFRKIPPVRCCVPNANTTYMVPDRDHQHWEKRGSEWKFVEYPNDCPTAQQIGRVAADLVGQRSEEPIANSVEAIPSRGLISMSLGDCGNLAGVYQYRRIGYDQRTFELLPDGSIGVGAAGCERHWHPEPFEGGWRIAVTGDAGDVRFFLQLCQDGRLRGRWLKDEKMPVELVPIAQSQTVASVDIDNGKLQRWDPIQSARLFKHYDPAWKLPVATRGNGALWLIDPAIERSDLDASAQDHEDWIFKYLALPEGGTFLDLASFIGTTAVWSAKQDVNVIAVEPMPQNLELLRKNLILNGLDKKVRVIPKAFGAKVGFARMTFSHYTSQFDRDGALKVDVTTIDQEFANATRLDLIKLDVEGAECEVIKGGMETIRRLRPRIVVEVHSHMPGREANGDVLARQFFELGYQFRRIWTNTPAYYYIEATPKESYE